MAQAQQSPSLAGSIRMFQAAGISVYLHWSWLVVGYLELQFRANQYTFQGWAVLEYVMLFVIVLMHEFGHALACRQVGGRADEIVLWPLGGIAFVAPPPRPGALLWSIAAGPLVNVVLVPVTFGIYYFATSQGLTADNPDLERFLNALRFLNLTLLIFNMFPIYPLDGGQILHALLWFVMGRAKSLMVASVLGILGVIGMLALIGLAVYTRFIAIETSDSIWFGILAVFAIMRCISGIQQARILAQLEHAPRHPDATCPSCHAHPLKGNFWRCDQCGTRFDTFTHHGVCPACHERFRETACPECTQSHHIDDWFRDER